MTKKIKVASVFSSIISQLYTFALVALGVALLITDATGSAVFGLLADIEACYVALAGMVGLDTWIVLLATTIAPAVLIEIFAFVQMFSPKLSVDKAMLTLTVVVMALCSVVWTIFVLTLAATMMYAAIGLAVVWAPVLLQVIFTCVLFACGCKMRKAVQSQDAVDSNSDAQAAQIDVEEEVEPVEETVEETPVAEETVEEVAEETVEEAPVVEEVVEPAVEIPYQPGDTMSTVELLTSIYGKVDSDAPVNNEVLAKIDKLVQYRKQGLISADECDMLCSSILRESNN